MKPAAKSFARFFANSVALRGLTRRDQPARGDTRSHFGAMRSTMRRGGFWPKAAISAAATNSTKAGSRKAPAASISAAMSAEALRPAPRSNKAL